jgi:hypothetical protein
MEKDPSMEDILASIRRIINEDAPPPPPLARPSPTEPTPPTVEDEVLELIEPEAAVAAPAPITAAAPAGSARTIEDLVREMLRPMLQQWLDTNLPDLVRQQVASEISRIARRD